MHPERRWKAHEWKINFAYLLNEILMAFNKILSHIEILKLKYFLNQRYKASSIIHVFAFLINFHYIKFCCIVFSQNRNLQLYLSFKRTQMILVIFKILVSLLFFFLYKTKDLLNFSNKVSQILVTFDTKIS